MKRLKIVVIPDKFKGSLSSLEAGEAIRRGIIKVMPFCDVRTVCVADGGDGTVEAYLSSVGGERIKIEVTGPNFKKVAACFALLDGGEVVVEIAQSSGMSVADKGSNPLYTTSYGAGELIGAALRAGCREIIVGIGGSATTDGGIGMAAALGARFLDSDGAEIEHTGGGLSRLCRIDMSGFDVRVRAARIRVACDVDNPLCGDNGAAAVFSPQKGADAAAVRILDDNLRHLAAIIRRDLGFDVLSLKGGGAAGGLGAGLSAFCGAELTSGTDLLLDTVDFERAAADADYIVTGEGCFDRQSLSGKLPFGIARRSGGVPVAIIAGRVELTDEEIKKAGFFTAIESADRALSFDEIRTRAFEDLTSAAVKFSEMIARK